MEKPARSQLEFSVVSAQFAAAGVSELPAGVAELTRKEMRFVIGVLEHGQLTRAAIEAGYSESSAASIASETLKKPKVFAFYRRCVDKVAGQADLVLRRIYERSVVFHAKAISAAQERADAENWLLASNRQELGKNAKDVKVFELQRDRAMREEKHYSGLARAEDALLLNALGRLKVSPLDPNAISAVSDEVRDELARLASAGVDITAEAVGARN